MHSRRKILIVGSVFGLALLFHHLWAQEHSRVLSVYSPSKHSTLQLSSQNGVDYADLGALLQPLGPTDLTLSGHSARVRFANAKRNGGKAVEAEFKEGSQDCRVSGHKVLLASAALFQNGKLLVPLHGIGAVLQPLTGFAVIFNERAGRLFLDVTPAAFTADLQRGSPSTLALHFPIAVNPTISAEADTLRITFSREAVVAATDSQSFDDKLFTGFAYSEANGAAEATVSAKAPLLASFADGGKTILITAAPAPQANAAPPVAEAGAAAPTANANGAAAGKPQSVTPAGGSPLSIRSFTVVIDAAHGGTDSGSRFSEKLLEKDVTLALARKLHANLQDRHISSLLLRDGDAEIAADQRATIADSANGTYYVALHAARPATGVRIYTAMLKQESRSALLRWETAQSAMIDRSSAFSSSLSDAFAAGSIRVTTSQAKLRPLSSVTCAAVAIEISPPDASSVESVDSDAYLKRVADAIASAIAAQLKLGGTP